MPTEPSRQYRPLQTMGGLTLQYCRCRGASVGPARDEQHLSFSVSLVDRGVSLIATPGAMRCSVPVG